MRGPDSLARALPGVVLRSTTLRIVRSSVARRRPKKKLRRSPPRSLTFPPDLWREVERFARERRLPPAAAVRSLVNDQLRAVRELEQLRRARQWQLEQAIGEAEAIAAGDRRTVPWSRLEATHRAALARFSERGKRAAR